MDSLSRVVPLKRVGTKTGHRDLEAADAVSLVREGTAQPGYGRARASAARGAANRGDLAGARTLAAGGAGDARFCVEVLVSIPL